MGKNRARRGPLRLGSRGGRTAIIGVQVESLPISSSIASLMTMFPLETGEGRKNRLTRHQNSVDPTLTRRSVV